MSKNLEHIPKHSDCDLLDQNSPLPSKIHSSVIQANNYISPMVESQLFTISRVFSDRLTLVISMYYQLISLIHAHVINTYIRAAH